MYREKKRGLKTLEVNCRKSAQNLQNAQKGGYLVYIQNKFSFWLDNGAVHSDTNPKIYLHI